MQFSRGQKIKNFGIKTNIIYSSYSVSVVHQYSLLWKVLVYQKGKMFLSLT